MAGTNFKVKNGLEIQSGTVIAGGGAGTSGQVLSSTGTGVQWVNAATGTGDVVGPASATDNAVVRFDGTTGKLIQDSTVTLSDTGVLTVPELSTTSITSTGNNPIIIAPDGTGDVHLNADSVRIGDNNTDATLITRGTGDLLLTTNEGSATEGIIRIYDGANGNITLTPNGTGQVQVGSDQVVTLTASQTLTNKTLSTSSVWNGNTIGVAYGGTGLTTLTAGYIPYGNGTSAFGSSANLFWDSTNSRLGLGITTPSATLHLQGSSPYIWIYNDDETDSGIKFGDTQNTAERFQVVYDSSAHALKFVNVNDAASILTERLRINASGQLVLGNGDAVASPSGGTLRGTDGSGTDISGASLTIQGGRSTGTGTGGSVIFNTTAAAGTTGSSLNAVSERMRITSAGNVGIGTASPGEKLHIEGNLYFGTTSRTIAQGGSANMVLQVNTGQFVFVSANGATERMRINASGEIVLGNGNTSPTPTNATLRGTDGTGTDIAGASLTIQAGRGTGTGAGGVIAFNTAAAAGTTGSSLNTVTEKMRLTSAGNLGVGTQSPSFGLTVTKDNGSGYSAGFRSNTSSPYIAFITTGGLTQIQGLNSALSAAVDIGLQPAGGNVGIGTNSPSMGLTVNKDNGSGYSAGYRANTSSPYITFQTTSGITQIQGLNSTASAANDIAMQIGGGNVGVGTASPDAKLSVNGVGSFGSGTAALPSIAQFGDLDTGRWSPAANTLAWSTGGSERMRIDSNGNVGIGTSTVVANFGGYKTLELNGTTGGLLSLDSNGTNNLQMYTNGSTVNVVTIGALPLTFGTNSTERMRITSGGELLIGNTTGTEKLTVTGKIKASDVLLGNNGTKGYGAITTTTSTSTPTGGASGDFTLIY